MEISLKKNSVQFCFFAARPAHTRRTLQRQGFDSDGGENELHQSVAIFARIRYFAVRGQVYGRQEGGADRNSLQPADANGPHDWRSYENVEIQHYEGE